MLKILLLFAISLTYYTFTMTPSKRAAAESLTELSQKRVKVYCDIPSDIIDLLLLFAGENIQDINSFLLTLRQVNSKFKNIIDDQCITRKLIKHFAQKFNVNPLFMASKLRTPSAIAFSKDIYNKISYKLNKLFKEPISLNEPDYEDYYLKNRIITERNTYLIPIFRSFNDDPEKNHLYIIELLPDLSLSKKNNHYIQTETDNVHFLYSDKTLYLAFAENEPEVMIENPEFKEDISLVALQDGKLYPEKRVVISISDLLNLQPIDQILPEAEIIGASIVPLNLEARNNKLYLQVEFRITIATNPFRFLITLPIDKETLTRIDEEIEIIQR